MTSTTSHNTIYAGAFAGLMAGIVVGLAGFGGQLFVPLVPAVLLCAFGALAGSALQLERERAAVVRPVDEARWQRRVAAHRAMAELESRR